MSNVYSKLLNNNNRDNVFFDSFEEVKKCYKDVAGKEIWDDASTIVLYDTADYIGMFPKSDIIVVYNDNGEPVIVTERIFKKNYTRRQWFYLKRSLKAKLRYVTTEFGYSISISFGHGYIDYVHYKEDWWEWARKT